MSNNDSKKVVFNPLNTTINTLDVPTSKNEAQNYENFYNHIKNNLYVARKSIYVVCRTLVQAQTELHTKGKFEELCKDLKLSDATVSKYLTVGKSNRVFELVSTGKAPISWTTMYYLATLSKEQYDKIKSMIDVDVPIKEYKEKLNVKKSVTEVDPFCALNLVFNRASIDEDNDENVEAFYEDLNQLVETYDFVDFKSYETQTKTKSSLEVLKEKISSYFKHIEKEVKAVTTSDDVTDALSKVA